MGDFQHLIDQILYTQPFSITDYTFHAISWHLKIFRLSTCYFESVNICPFSSPSQKFFTGKILVRSYIGALLFCVTILE